MSNTNNLTIQIENSKVAAGAYAGRQGAEAIREAIRERGYANIIVATGASQFEMFEALVKEEGIDWSKVTGFHLDEYVGVSITHGASFRKYLWERFVSQLPLPMAGFHYVNGEDQPEEECNRVGALIQEHPIDVCFAGIGENGHLAFNDPPADFETEAPYLVVDLDLACRKQQMGEGWFPTIEDVPKQAISMSIRQILKSKLILCTVLDERKAQAVKYCVTGEVSPRHPASILQQHPATTIILDPLASSLLQ